MRTKATATNVIPLARALKALAAQERYREQLEEAVDHLEQCAEELFTDAVNLAANGPWREWDAEQAIGTQAEITMEALADTKDAKLTMVVNMIAQLRSLAETLKKP